MHGSARIVVTGKSGQLSIALSRAAGLQHDITAIARPEVDITNWRSTRDAIVGIAPEIVIHAAAETNVDGCESDPERAFRVNALGTRHVAQACALAGARLVYVSTNYVFDGAKPDPYHEFDAPRPISVYGASKLAGEHEAMLATNRCYVARTSMLYSESGHNFALTMRRLMAERESLSVVSDQYGNPTYAGDLAGAILRLIDVAPFGIYHLVNSGTASWHDWATELRDLSGAKCAILPITAAEYPRAAAPPANGTMISLPAAELELELPDWRDALRRCFPK